MMISCYNCNKKGEAIEVTLRSGRKRIKAEGFRSLNRIGYLCKECNKNKCRRCKILLSSTRKCKCGEYHGRGEESFCSECYKKIKTRLV